MIERFLLPDRPLSLKSPVNFPRSCALDAAHNVDERKNLAATFVD